MSLVVPAFAQNDFVVPATGLVSCFSQGAYTVSQSIPGSATPVFTLLSAQPAGAAVFTSSAFAAGATVRIDASGGQLVAVDVGLAPSPKLERSAMSQGTIATAVNVTATLTVPQMAGGIITSTTAAAVAATLPTGAVLDLAGNWGIGEGLLWSSINTGGANAFTLTASAGHTIVGAAAVAQSTSARWNTVKTAAATYITYRV